VRDRRRDRSARRRAARALHPRPGPGGHGVLRLGGNPHLRRLRRLVHFLGPALRRDGAHDLARAAPVLCGGPVYHLGRPPDRHGDHSTPGPHHASADGRDARKKEPAMKRWTLLLVVATLTATAPASSQEKVVHFSSINGQTGQSAPYGSKVIEGVNLA